MEQEVHPKTLSLCILWIILQRSSPLLHCSVTCWRRSWNVEFRVVWLLFLKFAQWHEEWKQHGDQMPFGSRGRIIWRIYLCPDKPCWRYWINQGALLYWRCVLCWNHIIAIMCTSSSRTSQFRNPIAIGKWWVKFQTTPSVQTGFPAIIQRSLSEHLNISKIKNLKQSKTGVAQLIY